MPIFSECRMCALTVGKWFYPKLCNFTTDYNHVNWFFAFPCRMMKYHLLQNMLLSCNKTTGRVEFKGESQVQETYSAYTVATLTHHTAGTFNFIVINLPIYLYVHPSLIHPSIHISPSTHSSCSILPCIHLSNTISLTWHVQMQYFPNP